MRLWIDWVRDRSLAELHEQKEAKEEILRTIEKEIERRGTNEAAAYKVTRIEKATLRYVDDVGECYNLESTVDEIRKILDE